jgi:GntR family transcriptional regulator, transcriptional repressor for pyruvate dehydrogenase complex
MVAGLLRERILDGTLSDGDSLPRQEDMLEEFAVSKPSLREALRILEAEGLITVRRGNRGGAIVHAPRARNAGDTIGLVLKAQRVPVGDLRDALRHLEPLCAGLCAARADRRRAVVPRLKAAHDASLKVIDNEVEFVQQARRFHEELVAGCGNETLKLVVGALESLWSKQEEDWAKEATVAGGFPARERRMEGVRAHERLIELIQAGEEMHVARAARKHLDATRRYSLSKADAARSVT